MHFARTRTPALILLAALAAASGAVAGSPAPAELSTDGTHLDYTVRPGDTLMKICAAHRHLTRHYSLDDMLADIRRANRLDSHVLRIGQKLEIPVAPRRPSARVAHRVADGAEVRGMYLTGPACGVSSVLPRVDNFVAAGGNTVVFDAKDIDGAVSFYSRHPLASWGAGRETPVISSLDDMLNRFENRGLYVVARIALFLDGELGTRRPDLALRDSTGAAWVERGCVWVNPAHPAVVGYNLGLAVELARAGVDEIQFDYVRFPTNGWRAAGEDHLEEAAANRRAAINAFLTAARDSLADFEVKVSADLFGIMAWGSVADLALTGQDVAAIADLVDVVCPMIYPSHFGPGFEGRRNPGDDPEYFIGEGVRRFRAMVDGRAEVRPWLQAFSYRVTDFGGPYIRTQIVAARGAGGEGWCLWNPGCRYDTALPVIPALADPQVATAGEADLHVASRGDSGDAGPAPSP